MDTRRRLARVRPRLASAVARRFGIDWRALVAFRVALGLLLLVDLLLRSRSLVAFYTDRGVLPRSALAELAPMHHALSIHTLSGAAWAQALLFLVAGVVAVALVVGYRTRLATVLSLVLLLSLQFRNPYVQNSGDALLRWLLLWSVFLPLGERVSVDALRRGVRSATESAAGSRREWRPRDRVVSPASAGLLLQVVLVYASNALLKSRGTLWTNGEAIYYVLSLRRFTVLLSDLFAGSPWVFGPLGHLWFAMLVASPLLVLLTGRGRALLAGLFVVMHAGMTATLMIGLFPLISIVALLPFFPAVVWDAVETRVAGALLGRVAVGRLGGRLRRALLRFDPRPASRVVPRSVAEAVGRWRRVVGPPAVACLLALVLVWNAAAVGLVTLPAAVTDVEDPEEYQWSMFAPNPLGVDGWYVVPGELASGGRVDAFHGGSVRWDRPPDVSDTYPTARWGKYLGSVRWDENRLAGPFAEYVCRRWNADHETELTSVRIVHVDQPTRLSGQEPTRRVELARRSCDVGPAVRKTGRER
ncbi:HTTM domain-containing protein [Halobium salinum]|uniref:HTTM domain-containing protein n=1 Tax=Halobium salinum TaxID=1364940 RepID=A0ABD5PFE4_9EURY|nr:HTTM domain-containing protein [Halobium salinum]